MTETGGAFKDCTPGRVPWWAPSTITAFAIIWALGVKLSSFISVLLRRHKRHRETHTRSKGTRSELDLERGDRYSFQSSGTLDDSRERVTDGESTDNYTECELGKHVPPPEARKRGFSVKSGSIKLAPEIVHPSVRFQRLSSVRVGIQTAPWQPGQIGGYSRATINQVMRRDDITSLTNEERYGRLGRWLKKKHIGLSPRQQLMMKLYCERFTTVSYPAGIVMFTVYSVLCTFSWIFYIIETVE
ncbi:unnamed protein product [Dicrocoelium dendriticum]|nr:unnamed protein product [Dicrocoelium dendriticum]